MSKGGIGFAGFDEGVWGESFVIEAAAPEFAGGAEHLTPGVDLRRNGWCWLEGAVDEFTLGAGGPEHGEHVVGGCELERELVGEAEGEVAGVHVGVADEFTEGVEALDVVDGGVFDEARLEQVNRAFDPIAKGRVDGSGVEGIKRQDALASS